MKWNLNITTSKLLSYLILFAGIGISIYLKDKQPFLEALLYATITQGIKNMPEIVGKLKPAKVVKE